MTGKVHLKGNMVLQPVSNKIHKNLSIQSPIPFTILLYCPLFSPLHPLSPSPSFTSLPSSLSLELSSFLPYFRIPSSTLYAPMLSLCQSSRPFFTSFSSFPSFLSHSPLPSSLHCTTLPFSLLHSPQPPSLSPYLPNDPFSSLHSALPLPPPSLLDHQGNSSLTRSKRVTPSPRCVRSNITYHSNGNRTHVQWCCARCRDRQREKGKREEGRRDKGEERGEGVTEGLASPLNL